MYEKSTFFFTLIKITYLRCYGISIISASLFPGPEKHVKAQLVYTCLRQFSVGLTVSRKYGDLLSSSDGVHDVDGRDTGLDHLLRVDTGPWVNRLTLDGDSVFNPFAIQINKTREK